MLIPNAFDFYEVCVALHLFMMFGDVSILTKANNSINLNSYKLRTFKYDEVYSNGHKLTTCSSVNPSF